MEIKANDQKVMMKSFNFRVRSKTNPMNSDIYSICLPPYKKENFLSFFPHHYVNVQSLSSIFINWVVVCGASASNYKVNNVQKFFFFIFLNFFHLIFDSCECIEFTFYQLQNWLLLPFGTAFFMQKKTQIFLLFSLANWFLL